MAPDMLGNPDLELIMQARAMQRATDESFNEGFDEAMRVVADIAFLRGDRLAVDVAESFVNKKDTPETEAAIAELLKREKARNDGNKQ